MHGNVAFRLRRGVRSTDGAIDLPVILEEGEEQSMRMIEFLVVDTRSAYTVILGRPLLYKFKATISVYHHVVKFPCKYGMGILRG